MPSGLSSPNTQVMLVYSLIPAYITILTQVHTYYINIHIQYRVRFGKRSSLQEEMRSVGLCSFISLNICFKILVYFLYIFFLAKKFIQTEQPIADCIRIG